MMTLRVISKATLQITATWSTKSCLKGFPRGNWDANDSSGGPLHMGGEFWLQRMTFTSRNDRKDCKAREHTKWHRAWSGHEVCHWSELASTDFPVKTPVISVPLTECQPSVSVGGCVLNIAKASGRHCYSENTNGFLYLGILVPLLVENGTRQANNIPPQIFNMVTLLYNMGHCLNSAQFYNEQQYHLQMSTETTVLIQTQAKL